MTDRLTPSDLEYRTAYELSSDANVSEEQANEYWQVVRQYRGQVFNRTEAETALRRMREG